MVHPVSMQHVLTNSSTAEKVQQSNYAQTEGQQKHLAAKLQKEKKQQKAHEMRKSDQVKIKKEHEEQNQRDLSQQSRSKEKTPEVDISTAGSEDNRTEGIARIDVLV